MDRRPLGIRVRAVGESEGRGAVGAAVVELSRKSTLRGRIEPGEEVTGVQRLEKGAGGAWEASGAPVDLRSVPFSDVLDVFREIAEDVRGGRPLLLLVRTPP